MDLRKVDCNGLDINLTYPTAVTNRTDFGPIFFT